MMSLPLFAQGDSNILPPNYRRIKKEIKKKSGPYYYDTLAARFERCDTTLTVDHLRCLYYSGKADKISLYDCHHHYYTLMGRFGRHAGKVNTAWTQFQMMVSAVWSTGDGSFSHPLHVRGTDDAGFIIAHDYQGHYSKSYYDHRKYFLIRYTAKDGQASGDVWFYVRKR